MPVIDNDGVASLAGASIVAITAYFGGWEWALIAFAALLALWRMDYRALPMLAVFGASLVWLAAFQWSGDRRLFFPYAMQLAVQILLLLKGRAIFGGGGMVALFLLIRIAQDATARVLLVELAVALAILALAWQIFGKRDTSLTERAVAGLLASALAYAGLGF